MHRPGGLPATRRPRRLLRQIAGNVFVVAALTALDADGAQQPAPATPNIVIILADDLGWGDVESLNPDSAMTTPRIDSIAADGMRFTDAHSPAAACSPTRYGLLTGRYAWRSFMTSGVLNGYDRPLIGPDRPTLGTLLQAHGYRTAVVGKWHLGMDFGRLADIEAVTSLNRGIDFAADILDSPLDHGFDEFFGVSANSTWPPHVYFRNGRFAAIPGAGNTNPAGIFRSYSEVLDRLTEEAVAFIERAEQTAEPFFLYFPLTAPHDPLVPNTHFRGRTNLGRYGDFVAQVDWTVGQVLDAVERVGARGDTLVIFTSDNGSFMQRWPDSVGSDQTQFFWNRGYRTGTHQSNGEWRGSKGSVYEGGHRVPLLARWPTRIAAGSATAATVSLTDVYATLAAIVGEELAPGVAPDSVSLLPVLRGEAESRGAPVVHHSSPGVFGIRDGRWKLVFNRRLELYDMEEDPGETTNVAADHPEVVARLEATLATLRAAEAGTLSGDATLRKLRLAGVDFGTFASDVTTYAATVDPGVARVEVTAIPTATDARVAISSADGRLGWGKPQRGRVEVRLAAGTTTTITATVQAPNKKATTTYTVTVNRAAASAAASLRELTLIGVNFGAFDPLVTSYAAAVAAGVGTTTVNAAANAANTTVAITPADADSVTPGHQVSLAEGANVVTITVTAEDRTTTTYKVTVNRASLSADATLRELTLSSVGFGTFDPLVTSYAAAVGAGVGTTTLHAAANAANATVAITPADADSVTPGHQVSLAEGANVVRITVTAEDGQTKTYTVTVTRAAAAPLTARFALLPEAHAGSGSVVLRVRFSEPVGTSYLTLRDQSFRVTNGAVRNARRVDGRSHLWEIEIAPSSGADLVVVLPATTDCAAAGAVCTAGGKPLSNRLEATIPGPAEESELPVVSIVAVASPVTEGELAEFTFSRTGPTTQTLLVQVVMSSGPPRPVRIFTGHSTQTARLFARRDDKVVEGDLTVTWRLEDGEGYVVSEEAASAEVVVEENDEAEFALSFSPAEVEEGESATVRVGIANGVTFAAEQEITLDFAGGTATKDADYTVQPEPLRLGARASAVTATVTALVDAEDEGDETITVTAGHGGTVIGPATVTIGGGAAAAALTGRFEGMPDTHDGETPFTFELRFSEEIDISYLTLQDTAFTVTGGAVRKARRLAPPSNLGWEITVEPTSDAEVSLALPPTTDCAAAGAVCTAGGKRLSGRLEATVRGPGTQATGMGFSLAPGNGRPSGIWSDGATAWVADLDDAKAYAYRLADGSREPERDLATDGAPMGLWSDGETLWVASLDGGLQAHRLADGSRLAGRDLALSLSAAPVGVWSDGETAWVADWLGDTVHAYRLSDGSRVGARDIRLAGENLLPVGLWSDGDTLWVADWGERMVAYRLSDGEREPERDIAADGGDADPSGLWSDGDTLLATSWEGAEVRAHALPGAGAEAAVRAGGPGGWTAGVPPIADAALRAAIEAALGGATGAEGLAELEVLEARNRGIRSLAGLEGAVNLKELDLGFNPLDDAGALAKLPSLASLNLDGAAPDLEALGSLTSLERLSLRHNALVDLSPLAPLAGLRELDVGDNRIEDLFPLARLTGLRVLRADRNRIADPGPLAPLPRLARLDLGRNRLRDLHALAGLGRLRTLRLEGNGLLELSPLAGLKDLSELGLAGNAVEDLGALSGLTGLSRLDLRGNPLEDLRPLQGLPSLVWVHVGGSRIENLGPLDGLEELTLAGRDDLETPDGDGQRARRSREN